MAETKPNNTVFRLLTGIKATETVRLAEHVELLPANTSHLTFEAAVAACTGPDDIAAVAAFVPRVSAQLRITAETPKELAVRAWNSSWDALLLSAVFHTDISFNLESDTEASDISAQSSLRATNLNMYGLSTEEPYSVSKKDSDWIAKHFLSARELLNDDSFQNAVHCLASYRWHTMPRIRLAIIWTGIEGLFGAPTEIRFRLSLCAARFLHPESRAAQIDTYENAKRLYNSRSKAVHGAKTTNIREDVEQSALLLCDLLKRCIETRGLPEESRLLP